MISIKGTGGGGGAKVFIDGVKQKKDFNFKTYHVDLSISTLPYDFYNGCAVVFNNEIHILGGKGNRTSHYKWNGSVWTSVSTLPYDFYNGCAVVFNNEIHILGGEGGYTSHYIVYGKIYKEVTV